MVGGREQQGAVSHRERCGKRVAYRNNRVVVVRHYPLQAVTARHAPVVPLEQLRGHWPGQAAEINVLIRMVSNLANGCVRHA
jgi:hypothetical protein